MPAFNTDGPPDPARRCWLVGVAAALTSGCASPPLQGIVPEGWHALRFPGKNPTLYSSVRHDGRIAWMARADASASLWRRHIQVAVTVRTTAEFSWWVPATIPMADLRRAETADSPVRVAFAFEGDLARLSLRNRLQFQLAEAMTGESLPYATLMYVWDNHAEPESILPGARSDRVRKIVLERGDRNLRQWRTYRRPLKADFERAFSEPPGTLVGMALLTDSDNTKSKIEAWYGNVSVHS